MIYLIDDNAVRVVEPNQDTIVFTKGSDLFEKAKVMLMNGCSYGEIYQLKLGVIINNIFKESK